VSSLSDLAASCIRCGFCLEWCPTFLETGSESESPRGRIYLARNAEDGGLPWTDEAVGAHLDGCVGCRACETACPSAVRYGAILELARERLIQAQPKRARLALLDTLTRPKRLRAQLALILGKVAVSGRARGRKTPGSEVRSLAGDRRVGSPAC
jgi:glycolate oxidase iron-sulfur subunit